MKNKIYFLGTICCLLISLGAMFKMLHWPGAGIALVLGLGLFGLVFIPISLIKSYRAENDKKLKLLYFLAFVCLFVDSAGMLFKLQHWPGAGLLITISIPLPFVLFLPAYLLHIRKDKQLNYNNLLLVLFFFAYFGAITALLAINISKDILDESIIAAYSHEGKSKLDNDQTKSIIQGLSEGNANDSSMVSSILKIKARSEELFKMIDNFKVDMVRHVDNNNQLSIYTDGKINLWNINGKDNNSVFYQEIFTDKAKELKMSLKDYRDFLLSGLKTSEVESIDFINHLLNTQGDGDRTWEERKFAGRRLISIIEALNLIKRDISLAELEAVSAIADRG